MDSNLTFNTQISQLSKTLSKHFHVFYNIRNSLTPQTKKLVYFSTINSLLSYAPLIYSTCTSTQINKINKIQRKLVKCLYKIRQSTEDTFTSQKFLTFSQIITVAKYKLIYDIFFDKHTPKSISKEIKKHFINRKTAYNYPKITLPLKNKRSLNHIFEILNAYNTLPNNIKLLTPIQFKLQIQTEH